MNETRQEFISRMLWMVREIDESKFKSLDILSMIDFHLKHREINLVKINRDIMVDYIHNLRGSKSMYDKYNNKKISYKVEVEYNNIINKYK